MLGARLPKTPVGWFAPKLVQPPPVHFAKRYGPVPPLAAMVNEPNAPLQTIGTELEMEAVGFGKTLIVKQLEKSTQLPPPNMDVVFLRKNEVVVSPAGGS